LDRLKPRVGDRILDLGGEDGTHIAQVLPFRDSVVVADISREQLRRASEVYGFETLLLDESGRIPQPDDSFDIVFCSSVIEHVTVDKADLERYRTNATFARASLERQKVLSDEVRRVGKAYFVQTPNKYFVIESHSWLPGFIVLLPRRTQIGLLRFMNRWWPKKTSPDWHLLTFADMQRLFPDAEIVRERSLGMTKSIMAIRPSR
jgi:SAM-dependent methyltransferase